MRAASRCTRPARNAETEELGGKPRKALADLVLSFERWRRQIDTMKHTELAELSSKSGYTQFGSRTEPAGPFPAGEPELIRFMQS